MNRKIPVIPIALALALAVAAGIAARALHRAAGYQARLREVYDGAVLSALRQMEDMELALSKALLSEAGAEARYLGRPRCSAACRCCPCPIRPRKAR